MNVIRCLLTSNRPHKASSHPSCWKSPLPRDANLWRSKIWRFFFYNTLASNYPSPLPRKKQWPLLPINQPPHPQIDLELPMFTLTLQWEKRRKISKVFRGIDPKLNRSLSKIFQCWPRELGTFLKFTQVFWRQIDFYFFWEKKNQPPLWILQSSRSYHSGSRKFTRNRAFTTWVFTG